MKFNKSIYIEIDDILRQVNSKAFMINKVSTAIIAYSKKRYTGINVKTYLYAFGELSQHLKALKNKIVFIYSCKLENDKWRIRYDYIDRDDLIMDNLYERYIDSNNRGFIANENNNSQELICILGGPKLGYVKNGELR